MIVPHHSEPDTGHLDESDSRVLRFNKIRTILQWLGIGFMLFLLLRMGIICWTAFRITNRTLSWLPFALEMTFSLIAAGLASRLWARDKPISIGSIAFVIFWFIVFSVVMNSVIFAKVPALVGNSFWEPDPGSPLNEQNAWIYRYLVSYVVLTAISFLLQLIVSPKYALYPASLLALNETIQICVAIVLLYRQQKQIAALLVGQEKSPLLSNRMGKPALHAASNRWGPACWDSTLSFNKVHWISMLVFAIVVIVWAGLFIASLSDVVTTFTGAYYCPPSDPGCYSGCDPIDPTECLYPFPSLHWMEESDSTPSGWKLNIGRNALPQTRSGIPIDPKYWNELDGWSTVGPLLFYLPDVSNEGMSDIDHIGWSLLDNATVVVINTRTNQSVPHWVEYDFVDPKYPSVIIQPAVPMDFNTRYVVGVRRLVSNITKVVIAPSAAMQATLDTEFNASQHLISRERWLRYQRFVYPWLEEAKNFSRHEIQMAFEFVTMSREVALDRAEYMRDDALERFNNGTITYKINHIVNEDCSASPQTTIGRTIYGHIKTPLYLTSDQRLAKLPRTSSGHRVELLEPQGTHASNFIIRVPCSLLTANGTKSARAVIQYGHGLFGSRAEVRASWIAKVANEFDWIFFASDWFGMAKFDELGMFRALFGDLTSFVGLPESSLQGFVDKALALRVITGPMAENEPSLSVNGRNLIDKPLASGSTKLGFYGISQGGILGGAYVAFSTDHKRGVLGVPGTPYALLLGRSVDFDLYKTIISLNAYNWRHIRIGITLMGLLWDQAESAGWLSLIAPQRKQILIQSAIGDAQVTTLGAQIMARAYGAHSIRNQTRPIWGISEKTPPITDVSGIVEWEYSFAEPEPFENVPPAKRTDTHGCPRKEHEGQLQIKDFLESGVINQYCVGGSCLKAKCP